MSTVSPLSSPVYLPSQFHPFRLDDHHNADESQTKEASYDSIDPLTLEIEVQSLIDRVIWLDSHAHMVEMQKSILKNQEEILSRHAFLERHDCQHRRSMQMQYPLYKKMCHLTNLVKTFSLHSIPSMKVDTRLHHDTSLHHRLTIHLLHQHIILCQHHALHFASCNPILLYLNVLYMYVKHLFWSTVSQKSTIPCTSWSFVVGLYFTLHKLLQLMPQVVNWIQIQWLRWSSPTIHWVVFHPLLCIRWCMFRSLSIINLCLGRHPTQMTAGSPPICWQIAPYSLSHQTHKSLSFLSCWFQPTRALW